MANSLSRNARVYLQEHVDPLTIPNTSGTATLAVGNYAPHINFSADLDTAMLVPPDKTGTRTAEPGVAGRKHVNWRLSASLRSSGAAATVPPHGPLYTSIFGASATIRAAAGGSITGASNASPVVITQVGHGYASGDVIRVTGVGGNKGANGVWAITVLTADSYSLAGSTGTGTYTSGGTSARSRVLYRLTDDIKSFLVGHYRTPNTLQQHLTYGMVTNQASFRLGQDIADLDAQGMGIYQLDSNGFASEDVELQAGLTSFPSEPSGSLPSDGSIIAGFTGRAVINGSDFVSIRSVSIQISTGNELVLDNFARYTANEFEGDLRTVTVSFAVSDTDEAKCAALYAAYKAKTPIGMILQVGTQQYRTFVWQLAGVQLATSTLDDGQRRFVRNYSNCRASGSALGALDECKLDIL